MNKEEIKTVLENDAGIKECFERTLDNNWFNFISMRDYMNYQKDELLDKLSAEIDKAQEPFMADKDYDEGIRFGLMLAYQIINKYKVES